MTILLANITRITETSTVSIFYQFWATPALMYISTVYGFCVAIICLCMYYNRRDNLIYKVLNLAVLSVFVVGLWSYLTDVTFIYVVYILTFVSAVVMLFLSVVLMLPSSAVSVPKKSGALALLSAGAGAPEVHYIFLIVILGIFFYIYYAFCYQSFSDSQELESVPIRLVTKSTVDNSLSIDRNYKFTAKRAGATVDTAKFEISSVHGDLVKELLSTSDCTYPLLVEATPVMLPRYLWLQGYAAQLLLQVPYELFEFVEACLSSFIGAKTARHTMRKAAEFFAPRSNLVSQEFSGFTGFRNGVCFSINNQPDKIVYLFLYRPWWSPFKVLATTVGYFNSLRSLDFSFILRDVVSGTKSTVQILRGIIFSAPRRMLNQPSFVTKLTTAYVETLAQLLGVLSIYLLAIPRGTFATVSYQHSPLVASYFANNEPLENLAGIQYELYVASPMLILVCVISLLVALIGAALLVSTKVLNSK